MTRLTAINTEGVEEYFSEGNLYKIQGTCVAKVKIDLTEEHKTARFMSHGEHQHMIMFVIAGVKTMDDKHIDAITFQAHRDYVSGRDVWREQYWAGYSREIRLVVRERFYSYYGIVL